MLELYEYIKKEKFRREVQRNLSKYMHPEAPPELTTEMLEAAIEIEVKPKPYTIVDGVKCRFIHLVHPSFYERLPTEEEVESWLASDDEGPMEIQPSSADAETSNTIKEKVPETQDEPKTESELTCELQESSCKDGEISQKMGDLSLQTEETPCVKVKQEPSSIDLKTKPSHDYSSTEEDTSKKKKSNTLTKRKKKHSTSKTKREKLSDFSDDERDHYKTRNERDRYGSSRIREYSDEDSDDCWSMRSFPLDTNTPGTYYCKHCNSTMNSLTTYENHLRGKRHLKNVKMQNPSEIALNSLQPSEFSRYPPVTPNCRRVPVKEFSYIQHLVDNLEEACIGVSNVIEIRLPTPGCIYYCRGCDSPCSPQSILPHLKGSRHLITSLKSFDQAKFSEYRPTDKVDRILRKAVKEYESKFGRGVISVQRDVEISTSDHADELGPGPSWRHPSTGRNLSESMKSRLSLPGTEPDTSKSDFYCPTCDAHMNNRNMWEAHVRGKRHQKNMKKAPGELPAKIKFIKCTRTPSELEKELRRTDEVIVGLKYIRETQSDVGVTYHCFLCGAYCTPIDIVEHLSSPKHKFKYLEKEKAPEILTLTNLPLQQSYRNVVVEDVAQKYAEQYGRGKVEVYVKAPPKF